MKEQLTEALQALKDKGGEARQRHSLVMDIAEEAFTIKDQDVREALFEHAMNLELEIANKIPVGIENEPSRSITYLSAASLAFNSGEMGKAKEIALQGLNGYPPSCIAQELFGVYQEVNDKANKAAEQ